MRLTSTNNDYRPRRNIRMRPAASRRIQGTPLDLIIPSDTPKGLTAAYTQYAAVAIMEHTYTLQETRLHNDWTNTYRRYIDTRKHGLTARRFGVAMLNWQLYGDKTDLWTDYPDSLRWSARPFPADVAGDADRWTDYPDPLRRSARPFPAYVAGAIEH